MMKKFIDSENQHTLIEFELRELKHVLDEIVLEDKADWTVEEAKDALGMSMGWRIKMKFFHSNQVRRKVDEFNFKGEQQAAKKKADGKKTKFVPIRLIDEGLETIEWLSVDCAHADKSAPWHSDVEIRIEKTGTATINGKKNSASGMARSFPPTSLCA